MRGHVDKISRNAVEGWAADPDHPEKEVAVRVVVNGRIVRVVANQLRERLKKDFPNSTGRYGFSLTEHLVPMSPFVDNKVEVFFAGTDILLPRGKAVLRALGSEEVKGQLTPIVITSTGRAGTSLLMARLKRHPEILVARNHPHELMLLGYYAAAFRTLTSEADHKRSTNHENMLVAANRFFIGSNPYNDAFEARDLELKSFWNGKAPSLLRECFSQIINDYYTRLAQKEGKQAARYFAEKISSSDLVRESASYFFGGAREIIMVRDPRDVVCSSKSFWKRDFATSIAVIRSQLTNMGKPRTEPGLRQLVLHYEELILSPQETMTKVFEFLDLAQTSFETDIEKEAHVFQFHGTSPSATETIGRWKQEMSEEEAAFANRELGPAMERFGYRTE